MIRITGTITCQNEFTGKDVTRKIVPFLVDDDATMADIIDEAEDVLFSDEPQEGYGWASVDADIEEEEVNR